MSNFNLFLLLSIAMSDTMKLNRMVLDFKTRYKITENF
jgi:hypothetical protein